MFIDILLYIITENTMLYIQINSHLSELVTYLINPPSACLKSGDALTSVQYHYFK